MGIYKLSMTTVNRRREDETGRVRRGSAVRKSAYINRCELTDERTGVTWDYSGRAGFVTGGVALPPGAPAELKQKGKLANKAEAAEPRRDSIVCREIIVAVGHELSRERQAECLEKMAQFLANTYRTGVEWALHAPEAGHDPRNWHGHIVMMRREVTEEGLLPTNKRISVLDYKTSCSEQVLIMRHKWEDIHNACYASCGLAERISCETLKKQGIERIPQIHNGLPATATADRGVRLESEVRYDSRGRKIDWPKIDEGKTRPEFNDLIDDTNIMRADFGDLPLAVQIKNIIANLESLMERVTDLGSIIPEHMLPQWAQRMLHAVRAMIEQTLLQKAELERREEKRREEELERIGRHEQIRRMQAEMKELREMLERRQALQRLYMRMELVAASMPPIRADYQAPSRVISDYQYKVELSFKAERARAGVPPEYRPRIERPSEMLPNKSAGQGGFTAAAMSTPKDNGGLASLPPPIAPVFNQAADPAPEPYRQKVKIGFGPS